MRSNQAVLARPTSSVLERYDALHRAEPNLRLRDAAARLGVSEAELIAARCGRGVIRLSPSWPSLIEALGTLGQVMALTRNDHAVHEKIGRYERISVSSAKDRALVTGPDIDLRIRLGHWRFAYAVTEETRGPSRPSLQFFDAAGTAVHKVFLRDGSDRDTFIRLIAGHAAPDQTPGERLETRRPTKPAPADAPSPFSGYRLSRGVATNLTRRSSPCLPNSLALLCLGKQASAPLPGGTIRETRAESFSDRIERAATRPPSGCAAEFDLRPRLSAHGSDLGVLEPTNDGSRSDGQSVEQ